MNEKQFSLTLELIKTLAKFVPLKEFKEYIKEAKKISPDMNDVQYLALCLKFNLPLWSNDIRLKQQSRVRIFSTKELIDFL